MVVPVFHALVTRTAIIATLCRIRTTVGGKTGGKLKEGAGTAGEIPEVGSAGLDGEIFTHDRTPFISGESLHELVRHDITI